MRIIPKIAAAWGLFSLLFGNLFGQDFDHYRPMKCSGEIPAEFVSPSSDKFRAQVGDLSHRDADRRVKEDFLMQSNFIIGDMLRSGKVLFNDPVSDYLNRLKDYLLRDEPALRDTFRVYAVKSASVNAFCTNDGIILFNLGLFARLENEAEVALVLCHEFQHFIHQHPINKYVFTENLKESNRGALNWNQYSNILLERNQYSREQEMEADREGLNLFLRSGYDPYKAIRIFDVLEYANAPYANQPIGKDFFETENLRFPYEFHLEEVDTITSGDEFDEMESTHPSVRERREVAAEILGEDDRDPGSEFLFGEEEFAKARKLARFECVNIRLTDQDYESALYDAYLLLEEEPESAFLHKAMAYSMYALSRFRNEREFYMVHTDYEYMEGEQQRLFYFIEELNREELNVVAAVHVWKAWLRDRNDPELDAMLNDVLADMYTHHEDLMEDMSREAMPDSVLAVVNYVPPPPDTMVEAPVDTVGAGEDGWEFLNKKDASLMEWGKEEGDLVTADAGETDIAEVDYIRYGFADLFAHPDFEPRLEEAKKYALEREESALLNSERPLTSREKRQQKRKGHHLGIRKVVYLDPLYYRIREKKETNVDYLEGEETKTSMVADIQELSSKVGLQAEVLSLNEMTPSEVDRFNDAVFLRNYIGDHLDTDAVQLVNIWQEELDNMVERYGTPYLAFTAGLSFTSPHQVTMTDALGVMSILAAPFFIYRIVRPDHFGLYLTVVWDVESNEMKMKELRVLKGKFRYTNMKSMMYRTIQQIHSSK